MAYRLIKVNSWTNIVSSYNLNSPRLIFACPFCNCFQRVRPIIQDQFVYTLRCNSTYIKLNEVASKVQKKRRKVKKYVELIQVESKNRNSVKEKVAKISNSSPARVLKKLGITSSSELSLKTSSECKGKSVQKNNLLMSNISEKNCTDEISHTYSDNLSEQFNATSTAFDISDNYSWSSSDNLNISSKTKEEILNRLSNKVKWLDDFDSNKNNALSDVELELEEHELLTIQNLNPEIEVEDLLQDSESNIHDSISLVEHEKELKKKKVKATQKKQRKKKIKQFTEDMKHNLHEVELAKIKRTHEALSSYLDVCINANMKSHAHDVLLNHVRKNDLSSHEKSIDMFNVMLHGWASDKNWIKLKQLLNFMEQKGPKPNLQSYAAALECLVRLNRDKNKIEEVIKTIEGKGFCLENIVEDCVYVEDQKEKILQGIISVRPMFKANKRERNQFYNCELLQGLSGAMPEDRYYSPCENLFTSQTLKELGRLQLEMESKGQITVKSIAKMQFHPQKYSYWRKLLKNCENVWRNAVDEKFQADLKLLKKNNSPYKMNLYPYMVALNREDYVNFMMQEIEAIGQLSEGFSSMLSTMQMNLGTKIMEHYFLQKKKKNGFINKIKNLYEKYCEYYANPTLTSKHIPRHYWRLLHNIHSDGPDTDMYADKIWPSDILFKIGQFLYGILMKTVYIDTNLFKPGVQSKNMNSAFFTVYRKHNIIKIREEIKPHPTLSKLYKLANYDQLTFGANIVPMISPPVPWTSVHNGGFLLASKILIRVPDKTKSVQMDDINPECLYPTWDSLNQLAECPWKINEPILDLIIQVFNNKGNTELDIPPPVTECPSLPSFKGVNKKTLSKVIQQRVAVKQKRAEMYSLWCDMLYKLSIANQFRKQIVWFPHNIDFRGRAYPCPPHFNHLGSDVSRSLLLFAKGQELGEKGLQWLKIHLINLTGLKKRSSLKERLEYCDEIIDDIMDSADNPLKGRKWWMKSDEPWQTLACCMELTKCLRSPSPEKYVCHFPVHQDGSCNGLQHYAALGRDREGAEQVNLAPNDIPQDVYTKVAEMVEQERMKDAAKNVKIAQVLEGFVSRKVVKQPVMTTVYGVTRYGAHEQITRQLKDISDFPAEHQWQAASYLVTKVFFSLQKMFSATKEIQDWLAQNAYLISGVCLQPVQWDTPLGLPVIQPYFKLHTIRDKQFQQNKNPHQQNKSLTYELPNTQKQKNAFPPNYIHCLDSSHMMLTSLYCQRAGITFASVHDCFWTHPNHVDVMNKICREQFVALHSQPLLMNLSKDLLEKNIPQRILKGDDETLSMVVEQLKSVPVTGEFELEDVLKSTYFFS